MPNTMAARLEDTGVLLLTHLNPRLSRTQRRVVLRERAEQVQTFVRRPFGSGAFIGIGDPCQRVPDLHRSAREAVFAVELAHSSPMSAPPAPAGLTSIESPPEPCPDGTPPLVARPPLLVPPTLSAPAVPPLAPPLVAPPLVAPPFVAPPFVAPPFDVPPLVAPPFCAPPVLAMLPPLPLP